MKKLENQARNISKHQGRLGGQTHRGDHAIPQEGCYCCWTLAMAWGLGAIADSSAIAATRY